MDIELTLCSPNAEDSTSILLIIPDVVCTPQHARSLAAGLDQKFKTYVVTSALPPVDKVLGYVDSLAQSMEAANIKRATVCGMGSGGSIAQALAVFAPKVVRRVVLIDATTRVAPGRLTRLIDKLERMLPLGLPMRKLSTSFDSRPVLHRVHCPTLIMISAHAGAFVSEQAQLLARRIPNSWLTPLSAPPKTAAAQLSPEVTTLIEEFLQVAVKRPQKLSKAAA